MSCKRLLGAAFVVAGCVLLSEGRAGPTVGKSGPDRERREFEALHKMVRPRPGETRWSELPWLTDLHEARRKAAREGKLMIVWIAGGGQPLGFV